MMIERRFYKYYVRCLSEGVDVLLLMLFCFFLLDSQVDVVQSVGRVMRKSQVKIRLYYYSCGCPFQYFTAEKGLTITTV
jgi:hypothetical protein